jgi:hypothetical protein
MVYGVAWLVGLLMVINSWRSASAASTTPMATTSPATQSTTRAVELSNPTSRAGLSLLDLDTGETFAFERYNDPRFVREAGVDLMCETRTPSEGLVTYDLAMLEVGGGLDDERAYGSVREQLATVEPQPFNLISLKGARLSS